MKMAQNNGTTESDAPVGGEPAPTEEAQKAQIAAMLGDYNAGTTAANNDLGFQETEDAGPAVIHAAEAEPAAVEVAPAESAVLTQLMTQLTAMRAEMAELKNAKSAVPAPAAIPVAPLDLSAIITDELFTEALTNKEGFASVMAKIVAATQQDTLLRIPELVAKTAERQTSTQQAVTQFYTDNPDLANVKSFVAFEAEQILAANPGKSLGEILPLVEAGVRTKLNLTKRAAATQAKAKPAFAGGTGANNRTGGGGSTELTATQRQIKDMLTGVN